MSSALIVPAFIFLAIPIKKLIESVSPFKSIGLPPTSSIPLFINVAKNPALPVFLISTLPEATSSKNNITISSASVCLPFLKETLLNALGLFVFKCCSICSANPSNALGSLEIAFINTECPTSCVLVSNLSSAA